MKLQKGYNYSIIILGLCLILIGCITPYEINEGDNFENRLVIEGKLTDALNYQEIRLSRTFSLDKWSTGLMERNANVRIIEDGATSYEYEEKEPGRYVSKVKFNAIPDRTYKLEITLSSGKRYASKNIGLPAESNSDFDLTVRSGTNKGGKPGVLIDYVNIDTNTDNTNDPSYYRFDHTSTYKIIAPNWTDEKLVVNATIKPDIVPKGNELGKVCYGKERSTKLILRNASEFQGNAVESFNIRYIAKVQQKIYHRYSIKVNQYVISREAFIYYQTLKDFSESGNVFSENQPGNIIGNINSLDDEKEIVIGYFEVSKILSKRLFFNYIDFYRKEEVADEVYFGACIKSFPTLKSRGVVQRLSLNDMLLQNLVVYLNENGGDPGGPYQVVTKACGDCRVLGDVKKPDFWID